MKVSINIVTWNSLRYLPDCLKSIFDQTYQDFSVLVIDNGSTDGSINLLKKNFGGRLVILSQSENLGFGAAHNLGIAVARQSGAEFVLVANPDVILAPNCLEELVRVAEKETGAASLGPKLLKLDQNDERSVCWPRSEIIDSLGLRIFRSGQVLERSSGEKDQNDKTESEEVFGVSAALALYRTRALEEIKIARPRAVHQQSEQRFEYFDEDFFAYKEDIDLAWRLRLRGFKAFLVNRAVALHYRRAAGKESGLLETRKLRQDRSQLINQLSYKNHLLMLIKDQAWSNFLISGPQIFWYEFKKFFYLLFFEPATLLILGKFLTQLPRIWRKRRIIQSQVKVGPTEISKWFE